MYFRYSSSVVAPMHCSTPRARAGFSMFAASMPPPSPPVLPAPTSVWISSMTRMTCRSLATTSPTTARSRSSKSPRYRVPARSSARSSWITRLPASEGGTLPKAMRSARPCAIEVLPTPGSPTKTGLFLERRPRMRTVLSSCISRPIRGSSFPSRANCVRSSAYLRVSMRFSSACRDELAAPAAMDSCWAWLSATASPSPNCRARIGSTFARSSSGVSHLSSIPRSFVPSSSSCFTMACRMCVVVTAVEPSDLALVAAASSTCLAPCV
mmetsp:Transcript_79911/g.205539  ORF Transcript_79911/g.205539 Transcript_79911/m.205539 type:complete len:268 (+) Transcript_79911:869-1672(+)